VDNPADPRIQADKVDQVDIQREGNPQVGGRLADNLPAGERHPGDTVRPGIVLVGTDRAGIAPVGIGPEQGVDLQEGTALVGTVQEGRRDEGRGLVGLDNDDRRVLPRAWRPSSAVSCRLCARRPRIRQSCCCCSTSCASCDDETSFSGSANHNVL